MSEPGPDRPRRILAVDFGDRRTGLAATDWTGTIVVPLETVLRRDDADCARQIAGIARDRETELIVVGVPLGRDAEVGARARRTLEFVAALRRATPLPVETVDEAMSTDEAHDRLKQFGLRAARRKQVADSIAAMVILERFRARR